MLAMGIDEVFRVSAVAPGADDQQASDWIAGGEGTRLQDYIRRRFGWQLRSNTVRCSARARRSRTRSCGSITPRRHRARLP